ncbi:MAG: molecular chaperone DnaJ [Pleurocapsa sp. MO_226.B13]|nr:molecular chaperone DnaJ [Pleurocapsa sp. MO_226.B13]
MEIIETVAQLKSQLKEIELQEQINQQEQAKINQRIAELENELEQQHQRRNQLDEEALRLYTAAEELRPKLDKLVRIANLSKEFLELHEECQDNQDLLNTLYSSVSGISIEDNPSLYNRSHSSSIKIESLEEERSKSANYSISIDEIKQALPNAEKIYQQLVAGYLEEYKTYQNYIVDGLDLIWYAVAFIAFGRSSYRKMSFKYHPDYDGSEMAMQLINTAWSISQSFSQESEDKSD